MKKFIIFLFLFGFGFAGYCATETYTFNNSTGWGGQDGDFIASASFSLPAGNYSIKVIDSTNSPDMILCSWDGNGSWIITNRYDFANLYVDKIFTITIDNPINLIIWGWTTDNANLTLEFTGEGVAPVITSALTVEADAGSSFSYEITASGTETITFGASGLPSFLSFNGDNTVSGTIPTGQTVDFTFTVSATNDFGSDSELVTVNAIAGEPPVITSAVTVSATAGETFTYTTTATGTYEIVFGSSGLPAQLVGNGASITGTLPVNIVETSFSFTVTATNDFGSDSKVVNVTVAPGAGTGHFDSDDDVPAINTMSAAVTGAINTNAGIIINNLADLHNAVIEVGSYTLSIKDLLTTFLPDIEAALSEIETSTYQISEYTGMIADDTIIIRDNTSVIKTDTAIIKVDTAIIKTNVIEINDKLTSIDSKFSNMADLLTSVNVSINNQTQDLSAIKTVLDDSLIVQQNQLITQNSILELLDQIANPADPPQPPVIDDPGEPTASDFNIDITFDKEDNSTDLKKFEKTLPVLGAFGERAGTIDYKFIVPLDKISDRFDPMEINFSGDGTVATIVSALRVLFSAILYYITLMYWFKCVRRLTD